MRIMIRARIYTDRIIEPNTLIIFKVRIYSDTARVGSLMIFLIWKAGIGVDILCAVSSLFLCPHFLELVYFKNPS